MVSAVGLVFLIAMFASFTADATSTGRVFGWINDVSGVVAALVMLPLVFAVHVLPRPYAPIPSRLATVIGLGANLAIMVLQIALVLGALTFQEEIGPVLVAFIFLVAWLVLTGCLGNSTGALPHGLRMGLLAGTYLGYPIWAFWLGRHLLQQIREPVASSAAKTERHLATGR